MRNSTLNNNRAIDRKLIIISMRYTESILVNLMRENLAVPWVAL